MFRLCIACFFSFNIFCADSNLKDWFTKGHPGDYIVTETNKTLSLLCIRSIASSTLLLEEITIPFQNVGKTVLWNEWVQQKAPGHTSWSMIEIDMESGQILECYSFSRNSWMQLSQKESLIASLLALPLHPVAVEQRKKIGPPPLADERDTRKNWNPPKIIEGKKSESVQFEVFETLWPQDGSELADKKIVLYFDPTFALPFWVQVEGSHGTVALKTIDAGKNLPSPHTTMPRRVPQFLGLPQKNESGLTFMLKCPKYYRSYDLFAVDVTNPEKEFLPLLYTSHTEGDEMVVLEIPTEELEKNLKSEHKYTWLLMPCGKSECYAETAKPYLWR